jgi:oligopeptide transport system substrate-binding protein
MAINREVLVDKLLQTGELPAYGFVPDGIAKYVSQKVSWAKMSQADREAAAIKLMSEAGYGPRKPLNIRLEYGPGGRTPNALPSRSRRCGRSSVSMSSTS